MSEVSVILLYLLLSVSISTSKVMEGKWHEEDPDFIQLRKGITFSLLVFVLNLNQCIFNNIFN